MTSWHADYIEVNGLRLHYYRTGGDKPPLVIAHAITDNGIFWTRVARALQADYDVVMYDRRGHGLSDAPESGYAFDDHAADLASLLAALDLEHPRLIGHSSGAATVASFAAAHPDLPACAILKDPPWGNGWGGWAAMTDGLRQWFLGLGSSTREELIAKRRESSPDWPEEDVALWAETKLQVSPNVVQAFDQPEPPWQDWMRRITCPILLLVGDLDRGAVNTPEDVQAAANLWREGKVVHIAGAGHMIHNDRYEPYVEAVRAFLAGVEEREGR